MNNEELVQKVFQGELETSCWAIPRVVKIFIASTRWDFIEERRILLENIGPELQTQYDSTGLEIELIDMHYGTCEDPLEDPFRFHEQLLEIEQCQAISRGCFFLCLVGNEWKSCPPPIKMKETDFLQIKNAAQNLNLSTDILDNYYCYDKESKIYNLDSIRNQTTSVEELNAVVRKAAIELEKINKDVDSQLMRSAVEHQFHHAKRLDSEHMIAVIREFNGKPTETATHEKERFESFKTNIEKSISQENYMTINVPWKENGLDPELSEHDTYLTEFQERIMLKLQHFINQSIELKPELNARNKAIQEVLKEVLIHLSHCNKLVSYEKFINELILEHIKTLFTNSSSKRTPIIIQGNHGSGKTSLLLNVYLNCEKWFGKKVMRILRFSGTTPRSSYNLELLRIICEQINLLLKPDGLCIPIDASFDPLYITNWFQILIRRFEEEAPDNILVILIDDLHRLNPLDSDIVAALSWLPIVLPRNVHFLATSLYSPEILKITPVQRERFKTPDCLIELPSNTLNLEQQIEMELEELETKFGKLAISRLGSLITVAEFGLTETELLELLMPTTGGSSAKLKLEDGFFNFSTFYTVLRAFSSLTMGKFMSGRILICWQHKLISQVARKRYLTSSEYQRALHNEIATLFFSEFNKLEDEQQEKGKEEPTVLDEGKQTPFQSVLQYVDVTYSVRHVEESWIHLIKAGDCSRLKQLTFCNFDFLLAAVRTISISYLRSIIEHARCYLLDRDLELIYYTIRKSSDVLTRDTLQLGAQIICWLRPVADSSKLISQMVTSAMAWCDGYTDPLLVPLTGWLQPPLPLQIKQPSVDVRARFRVKKEMMTP